MRTKFNVDLIRELIPDLVFVNPPRQLSNLGGYKLSNVDHPRNRECRYGCFASCNKSSTQDGTAFLSAPPVVPAAMTHHADIRRRVIVVDDDDDDVNSILVRLRS